MAKIKTPDLRGFLYYGRAGYSFKKLTGSQGFEVRKRQISERGQE